ncbi:MAG TPA: phage Gp37/Gp68 family protein [Candidatus Limnocylindrales bacterium]|nr:phage Gp37/Gp68 family protein [Candidatus Limnocylindrales bacterium]
MSDKSAIEWTDATWNPVTGCSKVSPGCAHCYAERLSLRFGQSVLPWTPANAEQNVVLHPERLGVPESWRQARMIFVNSMSDMWHPLVPAAFIGQVFEVMQRTPRHTYQILSKRPELMRAWFEGPGARWGAEPLPNVWLGTSIENDRWVSRADELRATPAAVRFISAEPLLSALPSLELAGIDWLIVGGESGSTHRPMDEAWVRELQRKADDAETAFFFKQWGGRTPKAGGRQLDGRTFDAYPTSRTEALRR